MTTISTIGRLTKDVELRTGEKSGCIYANFSLAVNDGFGNNQKTLFYDCTAFGTDAERLIKAKAKKGSLLNITGKFGVSEFARDNGTSGYSLKITVLAWSYIPGANGSQKSAHDSNNSNGSNSANSAINTASSNIGNTQAPDRYPGGYYYEEDYNGTTNLDDENSAF